MLKYGVPYLLADGKINPAWAHAYYLAHKKDIRERSRRYYFAHKERMLALKKKWTQTHKERAYKTYLKNALETKKRAVLKTNGRISCAVVSCGCNDLSILQANYIPGGHSILGKDGKLPSGGLTLYRDIAWGRVNTKLFNFLCPPHNAIDHLKETRKKFRIHWLG